MVRLFENVLYLHGLGFVPQTSAPSDAPRHVRLRHALRDGLSAGTVAALVSGAPSTLHALLTRRDPLAAAEAAGSLVLRRSSRPAHLAASAPVHLLVSWWWATVLAASLPRTRTVAWGAAGGAAIAIVDMIAVGRRFPAIRALPLAPQVADHVAFGATAAAVIARRRRLRASR